MLLITKQIFQSSPLIKPFTYRELQLHAAMRRFKFQLIERKSRQAKKIATQIGGD